jgi:hypothetical protein
VRLVTKHVDEARRSGLRAVGDVCRPRLCAGVKCGGGGGGGGGWRRLLLRPAAQITESSQPISSPANRVSCVPSASHAPSSLPTPPPHPAHPAPSTPFLAVSAQLMSGFLFPFYPLFFLPAFDFFLFVAVSAPVCTPSRCDRSSPK